MTEQPLVSLLKNALFNAKIEDFPKADISGLLEAAEMHAVSIPCYAALNANGMLDSGLDALWRKRLTPKLAKNTRMLMLHVEVCRLFDENNIKNCIIKGVASAEYYPDANVRSLGDVDIIVEKQSVSKAVDILVEKGFAVIEKSLSEHHILLKKGMSAVEVHYDLPGMPKNEMLEKAEKLYDEALQSAREYDTGLGVINVPDRIYHGIILLMHSYQHMQTGGIGLRHLSDWAVFIDKISSEEINGTLKEKLKSIGMWKFALVMAQAAEKIGAQNKFDEKADDALSEFIFNDIFKSGSFGAMDRERVETVGYSPKASEKKNTQIKRYLKYASGSIKKIWPVTEKYKILMPVFFVVYCFRILFRVITKKTRLHSMKNAYTRADFYSQLEWYKAE